MPLACINSPLGPFLSATWVPLCARPFRRRYQVRKIAIHIPRLEDIVENVRKERVHRDEVRPPRLLTKIHLVRKNKNWVGSVLSRNSHEHPSEQRVIPRPQIVFTLHLNGEGLFFNFLATAGSKGYVAFALNSEFSYTDRY